MTVVLDLPVELHARLVAEAARRGNSPGEVAVDLAAVLPDEVGVRDRPWDPGYGS